MRYRLGIDLGSTSLGWCVLELDQDGKPCSIADMGVRIFSDGRDDESKKPLAVNRRDARSMRRNIDRRDLRQKRLMKFMIEKGLMPADEASRKNLEHLDPYELRATALDRRIPLYHLGRALFHINQRRGFKSNLKTDRRGDNDSGSMKNAIKDLDAAIMAAGSRTLGEYLHQQNQHGETVRVRSWTDGKDRRYNLYPSREMYQAEVDALLETQRKFHVELTDAVCNGVQDIIFYQRQLKPPVVGKCRFEDGEDRIRKAHPLFQRFRVLQDVNHLEVNRLAEGDPELTPDDKKAIVDALMSVKWKKSKGAILTFSQIRSLISLPRDARFNLESDRREYLDGDETGALLSDRTRFGDRWHTLSVDSQESIVRLLFSESDPDELVRKLMEGWNLSPEQAEETANVSLEEGYASLSRKAIEKILPELEKGKIYSDAVRAVYPHHSDFRDGRVFDRLPYYGEVLQNAVIGGSNEQRHKDFPEKFYGKINNPSVHIALNQIRKLVNALIDTYGTPAEIVVELARDLKEPINDVLAEQTKNHKDNERINKELAEIGVKQNYRNRMLFKLWEDLSADPTKRCCPFSGLTISRSDIFSGQFEEEHLLPFSISFNDGRSNKVLAHREWNRRKGNRTPFEAFGHEDFWPGILARVQNMPASKQWRFKEDCWDIAKGKGEDIIARQLNDTRYMAKLARQYLAAVFDNEKGKSRVWAIPGQMTYLLREKWGLNDLLGDEDGVKDRTDHRHHAIDAVVVACTDRGALNQLSAAAHNVETKKELWEKRRKLVVNLPEPFDDFRKQIARRLETLVISHKPDHGGAGRAINSQPPYTVASLHKGSAYGLIGKGQKKGTIIVAERVPVESFEKIAGIQEVADPAIRDSLLKAVSGLKEKGAEWKKALADYSRATGTRRVRIHFTKSEDSLIGIRDRRKPDSAAYKFYALGGNDRAEIYCPDKGNKAGQWQCEIISNYHAHQKDFIPQWRKENPTAKLIMRLHIDDMVAYEGVEGTIICRVKKMTGGRVYLRENKIAKEQADKLSWAASANQLQLKGARKISVDILGRVRDPKGKVHQMAS